MNSLLRYLSKNRRSFFYALLTGLALIFALDQLKEGRVNNYFIITFSAVFLQIFEVYLNWRYATKVIRQIDMPSVNVYNLWGHLLNHITLPILLIASVMGFIYFNSDDLVRIISIGVVVFINIILFINIRSYYRDEFNIEKSTRYIYDVLKLVIFFFAMNSLLHLKEIFNLELWISTCSVCFLILLLAFLVIYHRAQITIATILYIISSAFIISLLYFTLYLSSFILLGINIIVFLLFYFSLSVLHHKLERTLTGAVLTEYTLVLFLAFFIFWGIS